MVQDQAQAENPDFSVHTIKLKLVDILSDRFNEEELKSLCFSLSVDYENLPAVGKSSKARELVQHMDRRDRFGELVQEVRGLRPTLPWQDIIPERSPQTSNLDRFSLQSNEYFTGREAELRLIISSLQESQESRVIALYGLGGIGKTALARKAAERCLNDGTFRHVIWVSAQLEKFVGSKAHNLKQMDLSHEGLLDEIAVQFSIPEFARQSAEQKEQIIRSRLASRPTLLILDNLETLSNAESIVEKAISLLGGGSKLLLTSRHKLQRIDSLILQLGGLDPQDAIVFLREEARRRTISEVAEEKDDTLMKIVKVTGGAPLAIKLVVGQLRFQPLKLVMENLQLATFDGQNYDFYRFIFKRSWDLLTVTARKILVSMSVFNPATGGPVKIVQEVSKVDPSDFFDAMEILIDMSLVEFVGPLNRRRYVLHPLTHYFVLSDIVKKWS